MIVELNAKIKIELENCNLKYLTIKFLIACRSLFQQFVSEALLYYFEKNHKSEKLKYILGIDNYRKKTSNTTTKFKTIFGDIWIPQIQIRTVSKDGKERQLTITRTLLGVSRQYQIPDFMKELLGWIGSVTTFRVGHNIICSLTNFKCSLMSVWNTVQWYAGKINLKLSPDGTNEFEADGTGIPTRGSGKRGSELKKVFQKRKDGKLQLVGLKIGKYKDKDDWRSAMSELRSALLSGLKKYTKIILSSDGDQSIINVAKEISKQIKIQKDKWHVFHQLKYYLWKDGVAKELKSSIIAHFFKLTMLSELPSTKRDEEIIKYIASLLNKGYKSTAVYLESAMDGFYTHEQEGNTNIYTSKTERSMRTTNQRINVGVWSEDGAFSICKVRGAYYYNGINPLNWKEAA